MGIIRTLLIVYCLAAAVGCGIWVAINSSAASAISREAGSLVLILDSQQAESEMLLKELHTLEAEQRRNRGDYSPAEAISASYAVQKAQEAYDRAHGLEKESSSQLDSLRVQYKKTILVVVPVGAAILLHLILLFAIWPRKQVSLRRD